MLSKLDLTIIVVLAAGCAFWIEQGQRVVIDAPTPSERAAAAAASACPDNDSVPYSANCLLFLSGTNWRVNADIPVAESPSTQQTEAEPPDSAPCPNRDNVPYTARCLAFLQGATSAGMRW